MMRKLYILAFLSVMFGTIDNANAQCPSGRYLYDPLFPTYTMVTDTYSTANSTTLLMDIYQPIGDTLAARPLIILAHGGSFVGGSRNSDVTVDSLCVHFAKRGYVCASIDYRLGNMLSMFTDSSNAIDEVIKAISDGKAAIRYFVKDRATVNNYKIDTNNIFIGGNSAGAVLYMHVGYIDSTGECPADIQTAMAANGGFEGNSGNAGYTTKSKAIINLAGALNHVSFVSPGNKPSVNAQGDADSTVPYNCALPYIAVGYIHVTLCGLGQLEPQYNALSIPHMSHVFPGQGHVPWSTDASMFVTVDSMVQLFLYNLMCSTVSVNTVSNVPEISLFPVPANEVVNMVSSYAVSELAMYDEVGRGVFNVQGIDAERYEINTSHFAKGVYFIRLRFKDGNIAPVLRRIVVN